jgi:hypothetical protein
MAAHWRSEPTADFGARALASAAPEIRGGWRFFRKTSGVLRSDVHRVRRSASTTNNEQ